MQTATRPLDHLIITLYDVFHEQNAKDTGDTLQRTALVPELAGWVNSQCAGQLFADTRNNNDFMNTLTPSEPIFIMRNIMHHCNRKCPQYYSSDLRFVMFFF